MSCNILLANDRAHEIPADIGKIFKAIPVVDQVLEVYFAPIITILSNDSDIVLRVL